MIKFLAEAGDNYLWLFSEDQVRNFMYTILTAVFVAVIEIVRRAILKSIDRAFEKRKANEENDESPHP